MPMIRKGRSWEGRRTVRDARKIPDKVERQRGKSKHSADGLLPQTPDIMINGEVVVTTELAYNTSIRETPSLIGSDKVEGTAVYPSSGDKVGTIERVIIDKIQLEGPLRGDELRRVLGEWLRLLSGVTYNPQLQGYEVNIREEQLEGLRDTASMRHGTGPSPRALDQSMTIGVR
jgi:hypothetical protein